MLERCLALGITAEPIRIDSQCKYSLVAAGEADIYLRLPGPVKYEARLWDHAAGWIILKEAGGEAILVLNLDAAATDVLRKAVEALTNVRAVRLVRLAGRPSAWQRQSGGEDET